jgi:hypothetical protein
VQQATATGAATGDRAAAGRTAGAGREPVVRGPLTRFRPARAERDELAGLAAAAAAMMPAGGPLGVRSQPVGGREAAPIAVAGVADRMLVGRTRDGLPEVRMDLAAAGPWRGTEVRLVAGPRGLEATLVVNGEAARRAVEGQLRELARALEARGVTVASCRLVDRAEEDRRQRRQAEARRDG